MNCVNHERPKPGVKSTRTNANWDHGNEKYVVWEP